MTTSTTVQTGTTAVQITAPTLTRPRPVCSFPSDRTLLPPKLRKIAEEYQSLFDRFDGMLAEYDQLTSSDAAERAQAADAEVRAAAVRSGTSAAAAGAPEAEKLAARLVELQTEASATIDALNVVGLEILDMAAEMFEDRKASGRDALAAHVAAYAQAVESVVPERMAAVKALALPLFLQRLGAVAGSKELPETIHWTVPHLPLPTVTVHSDPYGRMPVTAFVGLLNEDVEHLTTRIDKPHQ